MVTAPHDNVPARRLMALFEGFGGAYGTYDAGKVREVDPGSKVEIKGSAQTRRRPVTLDLWVEHVLGEVPLGIIPIRDNDTCLWGAIDVDVYDISAADIVEQLEREQLPLVCCRTKSGGVHLFLFLADPVPADVVRARLHEMAALLGYGTSEIFPKQSTVNLERGDLGSWLNMPYFGGDETTRYGIKRGGVGMTLPEFLDAAEAARQPRTFLTERQFRRTPKRARDDGRGEPDFGDGPPCMQHLAAVGFPEGGRNKGLFNLGTFAKRKYGQRWEGVLESWNQRFFEPPLPSAEVHDVIKQLGKKEYHYQCREHPLSAHCNSALCRTRRFGVGGEDDFPVLSGLSVIKGPPPLWFVDVGDKRMELTTEQLQSYVLFHRACMDQLHVCYRMMRAHDWVEVVGRAMKDVVEIESPDEVSTPGRFAEMLEEFLTDRHRGQVREDLLAGRPWFDTETEKHYFRLRDVEAYLDRKGFRAYGRTHITARIRAMRGDRHAFNIKGKYVNVWWLPDLFSETPELPLPATEAEPI